MKISELLQLDIGSPVSGVFRITTAGKSWQDKGKWYQKITLTDETGSIKGEVKIGAYIPLVRGTEIKIIAGQIQQGENGVKLYIAEFGIPGSISEPPLLDGYAEDSLAIIESKVRCLLTAGYLDGSEVDVNNKAELARFKHNINVLTKFVIDGK